MDWLKLILGEALTPEIEEQIKKEIPKHFALKTDFNAKIAELGEANKQLGIVNESVKDLKTKADLSDTHKAELDKITGEYDTFKANTTKREKQASTKDKLRLLVAKNFNPDAVDFIVDSYDLDSITTNEAGEIVDGESKMTKLKESKPGLAIIVDNESPNPPKDKVTPKMSELDKMTDDEYFKSLETKK